MPDDTSVIKILPETLTNKIAAGEVVNRPSSVVKELVENAIDSGADEITIIVREGGRSLIQVLDNGCGMGKADLMLAFQRHATSKIFSYEDLTNIGTLGFRGEALASIASVSQVEARSVLQGATSGHKLEIDGGAVGQLEASAGKAGTSISVKRLFYNTPARRKFLKSVNAEYRQILSTVNLLCLAYNEVSFALVNEDQVVYELPSQTQLERVGAVLGSRIQDNMIEIRNDGPVRISGFVGNQDLVRRSKGDQYLYFNKRFFTSRNLSYAVVAAYGEILPRGSYPIYIVFLEMDPEHADVNVHPSKMEIKFSNDALIFSALRGAIKRALTSQNIIPEIRPWARDAGSGLVSHGGRLATFRPSSPSSHALELDFEREQTPLPGWPSPKKSAGTEPQIDEETFPASEAAPQLHQSGQGPFERTNIWQVHNKYIISQIKNGLILIDQHVAHERILYEQALESFEKRKPASQQLLFPQIIELSVQDYTTLLEMIPFLENIGFVIKAFGKNTVVVEGIPSDVKIKDDERILMQILDEYKRGKKDRTEIRENVAASFACHSAIRAGDALTLEEMNALIDRLFSTKEPYFCPHGRPVLIHLSLDELDKRFKRH